MVAATFSFPRLVGFSQIVRERRIGQVAAAELILEYPIAGGLALHSGMDVKAYAESVGRKQRTVYNEAQAAAVFDAVADVGNKLSDSFSQLVEIHAAPSWVGLIRRVGSLHLCGVMPRSLRVGAELASSHPDSSSG